MSKIQEVFNRIQQTKKEQKKIRDMYKDALANSSKYKETTEKLKELKEKKKEIENDIKADFSQEFDKMETLKADIKNDQELISDISITKVSKGEKISIQDENNVSYEPVFTVRFRKAD
jgi:predicted nuclease with TOPRIM domain